MNYDIIIIGAGHAGCEAALACARMGFDTLLATLNLDALAMMPCNPSIGGTAKGHLVRELDALGGEMGRAIDDVFIQSRMLNTGKGPAVHSLRAQADKKAYQKRMRRAIDETERRRGIQQAYNERNGITPRTIIKPVQELLEISKDATESYRKDGLKMTEQERKREIERLEKEMKKAAKMMEYEYAAVLRDQIIELRSTKK